ncbi:helix-turn-helix domain-containing protein [Nocardia jiangxiensis]|uniref:helix-turn-helix domain-containing protein n=1 Tax=Nocardia jiangxiensis TaxID=282685 RepID=UPI0002F2CC80|nr:helix-turn-helix domain-containing protein [Nocardia jiangxiensis]
MESATSSRLWSDLIHQRFVPLRITARASGELSGVVTTRLIGHLQASCVSSDPQVFVRSNSLLRSGRELLAAGVVDRGHGYLEQDGRTCEVSDGAFALYDTSRPFTWTFTDEWRMRVYTWPRLGIGTHDPDLSRLTAVAVSGTSGVGRFVAPMFDHLSHDSPTLPDAVSTRLVDELAELTVTAALEAGGQSRRDETDAEACAADAVLREVKDFIEDNLADPDLTPARVAQAFFISTRTLHRTFARHNLTVSAWIKHRRLERTKRALRITSLDPLPISEIARRVGFTNPAAFSREFSQTYGVSPRRYRAVHT